MKNFLMIVLLIIGGQDYFAQKDPLKRNLNSKSQNILANGILDTVELAIANSQPEDISPYLYVQTYLSFLSGVTGYYSSNQAYYILENFFKEYKVASFKFENIKLNTLTPFATGTYYYDFNGNRGEAKVYITLKLTGTTWKITQIDIN
ncbi:DUF4783 domain-containing protein [Bacteroidota bacterium]